MTRPTSLLEKVRHALSRDRDLPLRIVVEKAARSGLGVALAPFYLRDCQAVGPRVRAIGRPDVQNFGCIALGADAIINSVPVPVRLSTGPNGAIRIGTHFIFNFGASVAAEASVTLGDRVTLGPYARVSDLEGDAPGGPAPVVLEDDVWLTIRVEVHKGVRIGAGTIVTAGSVVTSDLPGGVIAGGRPARVLKPRAGFSPATSSAAGRPSRLHGLARRGLRAVDGVWSQVALGGLDGVGPLPLVRGRAFIRNAGHITIGTRFRIQSTPETSQLTTGPRGRLQVGDDVTIGAGAAIHADERVSIGSRVTLGEGVMIMDTNFHGTDDFMDASATAPVTIGDDVKIGPNVTILKGAVIGDGAVIAPGSVVSGSIPAGVLAAGVLAKVVGPVRET